MEKRGQFILQILIFDTSFYTLDKLTPITDDNIVLVPQNFQ